LLPPQPSGGPHILELVHAVPGGNTTKLEVDGVLFGDVWLCLGEGNMEYFTGMVRINLTFSQFIPENISKTAYFVAGQL